jgi:hypothetical protein
MAAFTALDTTRRAVFEQSKNLAPPARAAAANPLREMFQDRGSVTERKLEAVSRLDKRVRFAVAKDENTAASVDAELLRLEREANVDAELASLKSSAKAAGKTAARKRKAVSR